VGPPPTSRRALARLPEVVLTEADLAVDTNHECAFICRYIHVYICVCVDCVVYVYIIYILCMYIYVDFVLYIVRGCISNHSTNHSIHPS
jgi:hypothetical protein